MTTHILGISAYYHDSAACLLRDGKIIAAAQQERFTRKKFDAGFPNQALCYCLREGGISLTDLHSIVFYDKPLVKYERLLETYLGYAPRGVGSFMTAMPVWLKYRLPLKSLLEKTLAAIAGVKKSALPPILLGEHDKSHAASAFYPSPFSTAAVLCVDAVGECATTSAWLGQDRTLTPLWKTGGPHSLGPLYAIFAHYAGFKVNAGAYKVMGLAPYGQPKYLNAIYNRLMELNDDGTIRLNMEYCNAGPGLSITTRKFDDLFGGPPRQPGTPLTQREMDLARSIQVVTEEVMLCLAHTLHRDTGLEHLCLAGNVALNGMGNSRILREGPFKGLWIQPAAGDAGAALGAALAVWHQLEEQPRHVDGSSDAMQGGFLGPSYTNADIEHFLQEKEARYSLLPDEELCVRVADALASEKVVAWFQGRMEFGPRALGARSFLGDPRSPRMQSVMNLKIKYRESFRPVAPSVLRERLSDYFDLQIDSPYMLFVAPVQEERRLAMAQEYEGWWGIDLLRVPRSDIPAVTHVDYSARIQTVHKETNPRFYQLLKAFEAKTGCGALVNTSFNVRGEPIVCSPADAYRCFMRTAADVLVLENCLLYKAEQDPLLEDREWRKALVFD